MLPPEVNSTRVFAGTGPTSMLAAAAAWDVLGDELHSVATSFGSLTSDLTRANWQGPASLAMTRAAAPYLEWLSASAAQAQDVAGLARAAAEEFEAALAATVHPAAVAANRAQVDALVATNLFGQHTTAIAAMESSYEEMWAQDVSAMASYHTGTSAVVAQLAPWQQQLQSSLGSVRAAWSLSAPNPAISVGAVAGALENAIPASTPVAQTVALVMGGSGIPIPPPRYVQLANDLYISRSFPGVPALPLFTPEGLYPVVAVKNLTFDLSVAQGVIILESTIRNQIAAGNNVAVFGFSQSATISSL
ncbi:MAG: PPE family protein, partial [Mycobacteriaceae bacterium]|nr:PPE family protein [Mycobacteriaceae bacterium]